MKKEILVMRAISRALLLSTVACAATSVGTAAEESILQRDLKDTRLGSHWIYDDVEAAMTRARAKGKPLLVLFR